MVTNCSGYSAQHMLTDPVNSNTRFLVYIFDAIQSDVDKE